jgi:hypothetical protein
VNDEAGESIARQARWWLSSVSRDKAWLFEQAWDQKHLLLHGVVRGQKIAGW